MNIQLFQKSTNSTTTQSHRVLPPIRTYLHSCADLTQVDIQRRRSRNKTQWYCDSYDDIHHLIQHIHQYLLQANEQSIHTMYMCMHEETVGLFGSTVQYSMCTVHTVLYSILLYYTVCTVCVQYILYIHHTLIPYPGSCVYPQPAGIQCSNHSSMTQQCCGSSGHNCGCAQHIHQFLHKEPH